MRSSQSKIRLQLAPLRMPYGSAAGAAGGAGGGGGGAALAADPPVVPAPGRQAGGGAARAVREFVRPIALLAAAAVPRGPAVIRDDVIDLVDSGASSGAESAVVISSDEDVTRRRVSSHVRVARTPLLVRGCTPRITRPRSRRYTRPRCARRRIPVARRGAAV